MYPIHSKKYKVIDGNKRLGGYKLNGELFHIANLSNKEKGLQTIKAFLDKNNYENKNRGWCFEVDGLLTTSVFNTSRKDFLGFQKKLHRLISFIPLEDKIGVVLVAHGSLSICCERKIFDEFIQNLTSKTGLKIEYRDDILKKILSKKVPTQIAEKIINEVKQDLYTSPSPIKIFELKVKN